MTEATMEISERQHLFSSRTVLVFAALGTVAIFMLIMNIGIGSVSYSPSQVIDIVLHPAGDTASTIIWNIRIPRALGAVMGGAFLAVSGLLLQVYFRNPIVGPYILGISSGATVMVSLVMLTTLTVGLTVLNPYMCTLAAILGSYTVMSLILMVASKVRSGITLLIVGLMMGYLCSAVTAVLTSLAEKEKIKGFILWELGSFSGFKWSELYLLTVLGGGLLILIYALSKPLNAFLLGEEYAASMGVNIKKFRVLILMSACALAGMVTSVAGPIAFVGMAVPHMARLVFGTSDNRILIPGACLTGAAVASLCDLIARMAMSPVELPLSAITAFFGAPIVLSLLIKRKVEL